MIYSLTIAPALDYMLDIGDKAIRIGHTNRPENMGVSIGGKGITVSRMLNNLKVTNIPILALGGSVGKTIFKLVQNEFDQALILETEEVSRIDVIISGTSKDTRFNPPAPKIHQEGLKKLYAFLDKNLKGDDILVLAGSTGSEDEHIYSEIMERYSHLGAKIFLDTTGNAMKYALSKRPYLIKPNDDELDHIVNRELNSVEEIIEAAFEVMKDGCQNIMVTMGKDGAIFCGSDGAVYRAVSPQGIQVSAVGAGDSSIAGFIKGLVEGCDIETTIKYSMAAGTATAFSESLGTYMLWKKIVPEINITRLK